MEGTAMPAEVMLRFLMRYGVEPHWLLTGEGPAYRDQTPELVLVLARATAEVRRLAGPQPSYRKTHLPPTA